MSAEAAIQRAVLLMQNRRFEMAEGMLGRALLEAPNDPRVLRLLAVCQSELEKWTEATRNAERAVAIAPDDGEMHHTLGHVWYDRNYYDEAQASAEEAIRLDPAGGDHHALLAAVLMARERWADALASARRALALDPDNAWAVNLEGSALRRLGQKDAAGETLRDQLRKTPEDAWTHANMGWTMLHQGNYAKAQEHFREALRLRPDLELAREGIVEAIKAQNVFYRQVLKGFLALRRLTTKGQWYFIIGAYIAYRVAFSVAQDNPNLRIVLWPLIGLYLGFVFLTWFADPLSNLLLRLHPFGKLALSRDERRASNWVGLSLLGLAASVGVCFADQLIGLCLCILFGNLAVASATTFSCRTPLPRRYMLWYSIGLMAMCLIMLALNVWIELSPAGQLPTDEFSREYPLIEKLLRVTPYLLLGVLVSVVLSNVLKSKTWRHD